MVEFPKAKYGNMQAGLDKAKQDNKKKFGELDENIKKFLGGK
jgi:hypothetical protein